MNTDNQDMPATSDGALEALLKEAGPRPLPAADTISTARDAVRQEWQSVVARRRRRSKLLGFAAAASVLIALFLVYDGMGPAEVPALRVADIERSFGSIYLLGEQSELQERNDLLSVVTGQTVVTGRQSGIGFAMFDGTSLRVDAGTRIEFVGPQTVFLHNGRVYIDAGTVQGDAPGLRIESAHGSVTHLGTQYIASVDSRELAVSVREGKVSVDGNFHDATVLPGQQISLRGSRRPARVNVPLSGEHWQWVEAMSPRADFEGRSVYELLQWVSRETGLELNWESPGAKQYALDATLRGTGAAIDTAPTNALRFWMKGLDLDWRIEGGMIYIRETNQ